MKYFKVRTESDQYPRKDGSILVSDELYTAREVQRLGIQSKHLDEVEVKKNRTYFMFGVRKERKDEI